MKRLDRSIRTQLILVIIISLIVLASALQIRDIYQQRTVFINSERRVGLTLIRSVNNTITTVSPFITTLSDIAEMDTRLAELVELNENVDFIAVVGEDGFVIFHSSSQYKQQTIPGLAQLSSESTSSKNLPGFGNVYLTSQAFDGLESDTSQQYWIVVASASEPIRRELWNSMFLSILVTILITLLAAFLVVLFLQHYFVRPLEQLTQAVNALEAGDLSAQVTTKRIDEIGQLARSFNRMAHQVAGLINTLEQRVKERTQALEIALQRAEEASHAKTDFLSNMSHELRTPLSMVIGYTSSMLTMPDMYGNVVLPDVFKQDIALILDSGKHLLALINDILDLSKVEAGKLELDFTAVDLNTTFDGVVATSLGLIQDKPLQLRQNYPPNLPLIWGDRVRVRQILLNLLSNAIKFTEMGNVTLAAEVRENKVYITVSDTGPGIPENALHTIFDRFEQLKGEYEIQGTGLGLDISQRLAQLHGSEITIESELGRGSTFAFSLPIATEEQMKQQDAKQIIAENAELFMAMATRQPTALIVATNNNTRQSLRQILESDHIAVVEAHDTENAADLATGLLPEFILMDSEAQGIDYQVLLDQLQNDPATREIPVILLQPSGRSSPPPPERICATLQSPVDPENLMSTIKSLSRESTQKER